MTTRSRFWRTWAILRLFAGFILEISRYKVIRKIKGSAIEARLPEIYRSQAIRFRETALSLEGLLIKVGQFFSTRVDVLPKEYTMELAQLQDNVPPVATEQICQLIFRELGQSVDTLFGEFSEQPVAAASLGQVHRAVLKSGQTVAVKILRPGIEQIIEIDLKAFRGVIWMFRKFTDWEKTVDLDAIYNEFALTVREELDYKLEYANLERFRENFKDDSKIQVPNVFVEYSSQRVLTMEFVGGYKINDRQSLISAGIDIKVLAGTLVHAYLKQALLDGFFHADPHPGNLFVRPDGGLIFIDFGMVGKVSQSNMRSIRKLVSGVINSDAEELAKALLEMGFIKPSANILTLQKAVTLFLDELKDISFEELGNLKVNYFLEELREFIYSEPFQIPAHYTFLGRAIGTLSGLAASLDPEMNILEEIKPYAKKVLGQELSPLQLVWNRAKTITKASIDIPPLLNKTLKHLNTGEIQVKVEMGPILRQLRFQQTLTNRLMLTIFISVTGLIIAIFKVYAQDVFLQRMYYLIVILVILLLNNLRKTPDKRLKWHRHSQSSK